uniref:Minor capsid protein L2 n=1 Tax=Human papillomavirus TaxID=10566 RepID=H2BQ98_9PAPI|nr:L2 protein [Human papillomavirus]
MYKVRRKRASPEDLYKTCATGDCPEDVRNKIEQNTLADRLLKWFSSILYFGGLGIGTGRGSGGSLGYRPINAPSRPGQSGTYPIRPSIPIESLGPRAFIPVDTVQPNASSIIPELTIVDPAIVDIGRPTDTLGAGEVDILPDPISDVTNSGGHPIITTSETSTAVLEVQPIDPPVRVALDSAFTGDSSHLSVVTATLHPNPDVNIFVDNTFAGETVGYEEIPLEDFNTISQFSIEETPQSSTPIVERLGQFATQARRFYNRYIEQVPVQYPEFLGQVSRLAQFEYTNPAFDPEVSVTFERDLQAIESAPVPEFQDIRSLSRPYLAETANRAVRVSRLGARGTIVTRSGLQVTQPVHFYLDLSPIPSVSTVESFELAPLAEYSGTQTVINGQAESVFVTSTNNNIGDQLYSETDLIDPLNESFASAHLVFSTTEENETISLPSYSPSSTNFGLAANDFGINIFNPQSTQLTTLLPTNSIVVLIHPKLLFDTNSVDFYLDPAFLPRKRRKIDLFNI